MPWWESRGGAANRGNFNMQEMSTRPAKYKKVTTISYFKELNYVKVIIFSAAVAASGENGR